MEAEEILKKNLKSYYDDEAEFEEHLGNVKEDIIYSMYEFADNLAIRFAAWAMYDPYSKELQASGATASELLKKYKDRPYINPDTTKQ